ncbi:amino acid permease [bacterium]|nr:amino acid permease [bacterium]
MSQLFARKDLDQVNEDVEGEHKLRRVLGPVGLTSLSIGAIIGAGIFVIVGAAAHDKAGPALILSFIVAGIACVFAALCYAEFAAMTPVAGSSYTYAYTTLGELLAWFIGWDMIIEYTFTAATVSVGWSGYFQAFFNHLHEYSGGILSNIQLSPLLQKAPFDYVDGKWGLAVIKLADGSIMKNPDGSILHPILNLPAFAIAVILMIIIVRGVKEGTLFNNIMVVTKVSVVLMVIAVGTYLLIKSGTNHWLPFAPYGFKGLSFFGKEFVWGQIDGSGNPVGMLAGAGSIFFAYIGFDAISTHAEEAKNPQRDLPIGIITSLLICTTLYIAVTAVLTGMIPYNQLDIDAPVADAFAKYGQNWAHFIISLGAIAGLTSVILVMIQSQPRILMAIARDGLLPKGFFADIHPKYRTPWKATILTGMTVAMLGGFFPLHILMELVNIGTLMAFFIVCTAVLVMRRLNPDAKRPFKCPGGLAIPICGMSLSLMLMLSLQPANWLRLLVWQSAGLVVYFGYGMRHSILARQKLNPDQQPEPARTPVGKA